MIESSRRESHKVLQSNRSNLKTENLLQYRVAWNALRLTFLYYLAHVGRAFFNTSESCRVLRVQRPTLPHALQGILHPEVWPAPK